MRQKTLSPITGGLKLPVILLLLSPLFVILLGTGCEKDETSTDDYILIKNINGKVFQSLKSLDENNQPKDYDWAISINKDFLETETTPVDDNILAPVNLPEEFKISGLRIKISGKKYIHNNKVLTNPNFRIGFGYSFEITAIEKLN